MGKEFWFGFMSNYGNSADYLNVYVTSKVSTSGVVSVPGIGFSQNFSVAANSTTTITVPNGCMATGSNTVQPFGIHVVSTDTISVFALNYQPYTSDASVIFPVSSLDREYRISTIKGWPGDWGVEYLVVATENATVVQITPQSGAAYTVNMNAGDVYQVQSTEDLSGDRVKDFASCKNVAVFVGNICTNIGGCVACDHLYEQILPISKWGKNFVTMPFVGKSQDYIRILANDNGTTVSINGGAAINLNSGQSYMYSTGAPSSIVANNPVLVMQYCQGGSCDGVGDPFSVMDPPIEQSIDNITFNAFTSSIITSYYVNISTKTANAGILTLDGSPRPFAVVPSNPTFSYARIPISQGNHTIISDSGFVAQVYGFGSYESYGYNVGFSLKNLLYNFTISDDTVCPGETITFTTVSYPNISAYHWLFGDGTTGTGLSVTHQYANLGTYVVDLVLTTPDGCSTDTIKKNVVIDGPKIDITGIDTICLGDTITLHAHNYGVNNFAWNTGSTDSLLVVSPTVNTTYTATGHMVNNPVCPAFGTFSVYVIIPKPDFSFVSQCQGVAVSFSDSSKVDLIYHVSSWHWDFGDGASSTLQNPTHVYANGGTYNVTLTITSNTGCVQSKTIPVTIYHNPDVSFTNTNVCLNEASLFTNTTNIQGGGLISTFDWDFGDATASSALPNPTHVYASANDYNVTLTITTNQGCKDSITNVASVYAYPTAAFTVNNVCLSDSGLFTNSSTDPRGTISWWQWQYGDGSPFDIVNWDGTHLYPSAGFYNVTLTVKSNYGCTDTISDSIQIYPMPVAEYSFVNACFNDSVVFTNLSQGTIALNEWSFGDASTVNNQTNPSHLYPSPGVYNAWLVVTTGFGCVDSVRHNPETYTLPSADFYFQNACEGFPVAFNDTSFVPAPDYINQWKWTFGDASPVNTTQDPSYLYAQFGTYSVQLIVTSFNGCKDSITKQIMTYPNPVVDFSAPQSGCSQFCTQLTDLSTLSLGNIVMWQWDFGGVSNAYSQNPNVCFSNHSQSPVLYDVTLTAISNQSCSTSVTKPNYLTVFPLPVAQFTYYPQTTTILEPVINFNDHSINPAHWFWDFGDGSAISIIKNPNYTYQDTGRYYVQLLVENIYGCKDSTLSSVIIQPDWSIYIPNTFTPNGDGTNDTFTAKGYGILEYNMYIYDRWGDMIFTSNDMSKGWDGKMNGQLCQQDVYVYKIDIKTNTFMKKYYVGRVTLLMIYGR